ncbi:sigma-54 dependent transcriptional regulator [Ferriphaselus sp. R-1]|uniref:sigma-54-dependent transcriptional regulator n=1 Tax=Ferriphaselus sp. R-1 TaxID=1485544 RepID=UPI000B4967A5|nr:sigma-54 dependent transcriptional regulator [Ferriphaselus sp. R-1]
MSNERRLSLSQSARVLLVDDEPDILELLELALLRMGLEVDRADSVGAALACLNEARYDLCLTDMRLPDGEGLQIVRHIAAQNLELPIAVITAHGNMESAITALKAGAFDYLSKPVALEQLRALVKSAIQTPKSAPGLSAQGDDAQGLLGHAPAMQKVRDLISRVARSQAPVHICGESGSGKELAARLIVAQSARREHPFIAVNCGAIPENLMESEFFGYRKGAFTGADSDRDGFFQSAHGGTLFLDEVADLPLAMQVKLLRAIQEKKVRKVGATQEEAVDVRIISATHNDLARRVQEGKFRQDLYYRLNVINLTMPPLRELRDDIPEIAQRLLLRLRGASNVSFAPDALRALSTYDFPGNVRELENIIERALALCDDATIQLADLQLPPDAGSTQAAPVVADGSVALPDYLDQVERTEILKALDRTRFNRTAAARLLGVTFRTLRYRMERLGIKGADKDED